VISRIADPFGQAGRPAHTKEPPGGARLKEGSNDDAPLHRVVFTGKLFEPGTKLDVGDPVCGGNPRTALGDIDVRPDAPVGLCVDCARIVRERWGRAAAQS
jgi:hypothetical protein